MVAAGWVAFDRESLLENPRELRPEIVQTLLAGNRIEAARRMDQTLVVATSVVRGLRVSSEIVREATAEPVPSVVEGTGSAELATLVEC